LNARGGEVSANFNQSWRVVVAHPAGLTFSLTVAVHPFKKPCIYNGFINLNTDEHIWARMKNKISDLRWATNF
jgi:hypothetical protein